MLGLPISKRNAMKVVGIVLGCMLAIYNHFNVFVVNQVETSIEYSRTKLKISLFRVRTVAITSYSELGNTVIPGIRSRSRSSLQSFSLWT